MAVTGVVLDPAGKPVAGAAVAVFGFPHRARAGGDHSSPHQVIAQATADRNGPLPDVAAAHLVGRVL